MQLRRVFLLGAAAIASVAALVAIAAVVNGDFGDTEGKMFATLAATFVAGSTAIAGVALLSRGVSRPVGLLGIVLAAGGYILWAEQIWAEHHSSAYWKFLGIVLAWTIATLTATATRLMISAPRVVRTLYPATVGAAALAALTVSAMLLRENGDGWQFFAVLVILAVLGAILAPIFERFVAADDAPHERLLASVDGVAVLAVRGREHVVRIGESDFPLRSGESVVVTRQTAGRGA